MELARKALVGLLWLYVVGVLVQFFLAGIGMPQLGGESMDAHEGFGYAVLHLTPIIFLVIAFFAKMPKKMLGLMAVFAVIVFVQPIWAAEFEGEAIAALHVLGGGIILGMAHALATMATRHVRGGEAA